MSRPENIWSTKTCDQCGELLTEYDYSLCLPCVDAVLGG